MRTFLLVFIVGSVLSGCFWNKQDDIVVPVNVEKPKMYAPPSKELDYNQNVFVTVAIEDHKTVYKMDEQSFLTFIENLEYGRTINEECLANDCYYRKDLKESRCEKYISHDVLPDSEKK
jgi:hypothetical protein